jgi:sulfur carrier protein
MQLHKPAPTRIRLNGEQLETEACTLADLVTSQGFAESGVATAVNGDFVPRQARPATQLVDGDTVEIVAPRQGG